MLYKHFKRSTNNFDRKLILIDLAMLLCLIGLGFTLYRLIISIINY